MQYVLFNKNKNSINKAITYLRLKTLTILNEGSGFLICELLSKAFLSFRSRMFVPQFPAYLDLIGESLCLDLRFPSNTTGYLFSSLSSCLLQGTYATSFKVFQKGIVSKKKKTSSLRGLVKVAFYIHIVKSVFQAKKYTHKICRNLEWWSLGSVSLGKGLNNT